MKKLFMVIPLVFLLCFCFSCQQKSEKADIEKDFKVHAITKVFEEAWNKGNLDVLDEVYAADFVQHRTPFPDYEALEDYKEYIEATRKAYPDLKFTIEEIIVDGDTSALLYTFQGTHEGQSMMFPIPPTGKQVTMSGCYIEHWIESKVVEEWIYSDWFGLMKQLGLVSPSSPPEEPEEKK